MQAGAGNPQAWAPGPFWTSVSPSDDILKNAASSCPLSGAGGCSAGAGGVQGDRNLASLCCPPPSAFLHPGPPARRAAPSSGTLALPVHVAGNKSCGALYCQVEKSRCKTVREETIAPRCIPAARCRETENSREYWGLGNKGPFYPPLTLGRFCGSSCVAALESEKPTKVFCKTENGSEICWDKETGKRRFCLFLEDVFQPAF